MQINPDFLRVGREGITSNKSRKDIQQISRYGRKDNPGRTKFIQTRAKSRTIVSPDIEIGNGYLNGASSSETGMVVQLWEQGFRYPRRPAGPIHLIANGLLQMFDNGHEDAQMIDFQVGFYICNTICLIQFIVLYQTLVRPVEGYFCIVILHIRIA